MPDTEIAGLFALDGPLAATSASYRVRASQVELAEAISETISRRATLVAEAGTGTGKTWAYLVPAFLRGGKVLVSTGTRTLQDQLFLRDLPRLRDALAIPVTAALLKGRANYVCHYHLERLEGEEGGLRSRAEIGQYRRIQVFASQSRTGDRADLSEVPEEAEIWQRVTSTRENCLGQECPRVRDCFVLKARRQAQEADVVVVNHALFLADLMLREEGVTDLLPQADTVIFDEAHQLPDTATRFLGTSVSTHQLLDLSRDAQAAGLAYARERCNWGEVAGKLETAARALRLACAPLEKVPGRKATFESLANLDLPDFDAAVDGLKTALFHLEEALAGVAESHPDLMAASKVAAQLALRVQRWARKAGEPPVQAPRASQVLAPAPLATAVVAGPPPAWEDLVAEVVSGKVASAAALDVQDDAPARPSAAERLAEAAAQVPLALPADTQAVRWVEMGMHHVRLHAAPLSVAEAFSRLRPAGQAWIMTSATLSVHGDFSHFTSQLGLRDAQIARWESPFDYASQGLLFVPRDLPLPQSPQFTERFVQTLLPLLEASPGGALVLCTTLRAVERVAELLGKAFEERGWNWPLLRQGQAPRRELLERFRTLLHPVLVGSASFWEGIDIPGDALTLVAIDKLPFAPPDDPVIEARLRACKARGGNPFAEYQLPEAAIALKQGAGRLIRTERDWGVLLVGDTRLVDKPYGKRLWRGLPPFSRTRDMEEALAFYQRQGKAGEAEETS
ncbi:DinG family ATP-dependent helicase YoaA [plant metagenome]|uniref:DinG family ATP-dependent helicase YoaA n=1 Tax=plant metagenome TaxID=1297885 RepID=A0A484VHL6_9ZZZZ